MQDFIKQKPDLLGIILECIDKKEQDKIADRIYCIISGFRYVDEAAILRKLASFALNKEKNAKKGGFENVSMNRMVELLQSEFKELEYELVQDKIDYRRVLDEIADCAATLTGLIAFIIKNKE